MPLSKAKSYILRHMNVIDGETQNDVLSKLMESQSSYKNKDENRLESIKQSERAKYVPEM